MPELPEVETIRLGLHDKLIGQVLQEIEILNMKTFSGNPRDLFGQKVLKVWRKAKVLGIDMSKGLTLIFHLKMTGQLIYDGKQRLSGGHPTQDMRDQMPNKSTRVIFTFIDEPRRLVNKVYFNDQRKFGWVKVIPTLELVNHAFLAGLGPEPLDKSFTHEVLTQCLIKHLNWPVKLALMDQQTIAGVGNIYASEACFMAGVDPRRKINSLSKNELKKLHYGIVKSLQDGVKYGGSSRSHYVNSDGQKGSFLDYAFVYNRDKQPCKKCRTIIAKTTLGGRGTFYCPKCQG